jgi:hypothetical protein
MSALLGQCSRLRAMSCVSFPDGGFYLASRSQLILSYNIDIDHCYRLDERGMGADSRLPKMNRRYVGRAALAARSRREGRLQEGV